MTNKDKVIKDLKERNNSLNNQYRLRDIRVSVLEQREKEKDKVINELLERIANLEREIERLHSIIKEVREHIENNKYWNGDNWNCLHCEKILEILDKEKE